MSATGRSVVAMAYEYLRSHPNMKWEDVIRIICEGEYKKDHCANDVDMVYILFMLDQHRDRWYKSPESYYDKKKVNFEYQSYKRSAIDEIKIWLLDHRDQNPIDAVEDFRHQVDIFACETKNGGANFMFSIYYDVATDVLDMLISYLKEGDCKDEKK